MGTRREQPPRKPPTRKQPPRKVKSVPLKQLEKRKSRSLAPCGSSNKKWITAQMSQGIRPLANHEQNYLVQLMKDTAMQKLYKNERASFMRTIMDKINNMEANKYSGYVLLNMETTKDIVNRYLAEMKIFHKINDQSSIDLSMEETLSYCDEGTSSSAPGSSRKRPRKKGREPTRITDLQSAVQYLANCRLYNDDELTNFADVLNNSPIRAVFASKTTHGEKMEYLRNMVEKKRSSSGCVLNQQQGVLGIPRLE